LPELANKEEINQRDDERKRQQGQQYIRQQGAGRFFPELARALERLEAVIRQLSPGDKVATGALGGLQDAGDFVPVPATLRAGLDSPFGDPPLLRLHIVDDLVNR